MKKTLIPSFFFVLNSLFSYAQKEITLEDIWTKGTFSGKSVAGFNFQNDGLHYTVFEKGNVQQYDFTTGKPTKLLLDGSKLNLENGFDGYTFSADESKMLLETNIEQLYRHSYYANHFVWDGKSATALYPQNPKQRYATFSKDGSKIAFVVDNNLYYKDLQNNKIIQVTKDGLPNAIINGATDWVYEEELVLTKGFEWSPDGSKIAFLRFDERNVPEFSMDVYKGELYPEKYNFKYPKVGAANSIVEVFIYDLKKRKSTKIKTVGNPDTYYPRIKWTTDGSKLAIFKLNRHQNQLDILLSDPKTGNVSTLIQEKNPYYISEDFLDDFRFLRDGKHFIRSSESDGFNHIYLHDMSGKMVRQLSTGKYDVSKLYGVDEKNGLVFFQMAKPTPMDKQIYAVSLNGGEPRLISPEKGSSDAEFSSTFDYFVLTHSSINTPPTYQVLDRNGKLIRTLEENKRIKDLQTTYGVQNVEFFNFLTSENVDLNGWMIKPQKMESDKTYPVLMFVYGGPGSQQVLDQWKGANYWWFQLLAQKGYVVACIDNRGTGGRGQEFKKMTYKQLGKYETQDQIEGAKYLGSLPYIDAKRIGIFGWSYGGYMSSLCILKGAEVFKSAIAVAPVTNWKWYDSIYTERYMQTEKENPNGYKENSPVYFADKLKGNYLLIHGTGDDNVHFQNSVEMANALINSNKQFDTYFYPNRNHGIYGGNARIHLYTKMTNFLLEKL